MTPTPNRYAYEASGASAELIAGEIVAVNVAQAVQNLESQGFTVLSIRLVPSGAAKTEDTGSFHQRLDSALARRREWLPALEAMTEELSPGAVQREALRLTNRLKRDISAEQLLATSESLALLPLLSCSIQGDSGGSRLHEWLHYAVLQKQRRQQTRRALIYPALLLGLSLLVLAAAAIFLIPIFRSMFNDFGLSLPAPTLLVFWIADQITDKLPRTLAWLAAAIIPLSLCVRAWRRRALTNRLFGRFVAGTSSNLWAMSSLTGTLAELLSLDAPLPLALRIAGRGCEHAYFADATEQLSDELSNSNSQLHASPARRRLPPMLLHALQAGVDQKPCTALLRELAQVYRERLSQRANWFATSLPAFAIALVGLIIGFVVIALFMPLVSMVTSLA